MVLILLTSLFLIILVADVPIIYILIEFVPMSLDDLCIRSKNIPKVFRYQP